MMRLLELLYTLKQLTNDVGALNSKLIILIGPPNSGKTTLLSAFADHIEGRTLNVGSLLGNRLASTQQRHRHLQAGISLHELADEHVNGDLLLMDNIELLFDTSLQLNPLDLLKRHSQRRRVVAVWPGELSNGRLIYAGLGHKEHRNYATDGVVTLEMQNIK